jgi:AbrB family looped-hinge helix DNA binding protein
MEFATLTAKSQITVPRDVREKLRLERGDRIAFEATADGRFILARDAPVLKSDGAARKRLPKGQRPNQSDESDVISRAIRDDDQRIRQGR